MARPILAACLLLSVTQASCAPYTWRTEISDPSRVLLPARAVTTPERKVQRPTLTAEARIDRVNLQVDVVDLCRNNTVTPIAEVVRTERMLDQAVASFFVSASVAAGPIRPSACTAWRADCGEHAGLLVPSLCRIAKALA